MRDLILQCAGVAGIAVALIHGVLGETKVFAKATIQPESLRTLIRLVWQAGTVAWIGGGVLLIAAPSFGIGERAALDRRDDRRGLRLCRRRQRLVVARPRFWLESARRRRRARGRGVLKPYCSPVSPLVRFLARSISVTAIRISARVFRSGASSIACFSAGP